MANLKEQIFTALKSEQKLTELTKDIERAKENLLKNHSNPVFNISDKNKILKAYMELDDINRDIGRFDRLRQYKYTTEALQERKSIEDILKGGMYNYNYIWKSENSSNTCEVCRALNGREFDFYDEVPQRPHPNCKCKVGILEGNVVKTPMYTSIRYQIAAPHNPFDAERQTWILPVPKGYKVTSKFGNRMHPVKHEIKFHDGIDINARMNDPVYAVADGVIVKAKWYNGYGNYIEIDHGHNLHSFYGHLNKILVSEGTKIIQGQNIGLVGNTGIGTGEHLHFGVHKNGDKVDPLDYLPSF